MTNIINNKKSIEEIETTLKYLNEESILKISLKGFHPQFQQIKDLFQLYNSNLKRVQTLNIHVQKVFKQKIDFEQIFEILNDFSGLKSLSIKADPLKSFSSEGIISFSHYLIRFTQLETVKLYIEFENSIDDDGIAAFSKALEQLQKLKNLKIYIETRNKITEKGATALGNSIKQLKKLGNLKINLGEKIPIGDEGTIHLLKSIKELPSLKKFNFKLHAENELDKLFSENIFNDFQDFESRKQLEVLKLKIGGWNSLQVKGLQQVSQQISYFENLKRLQLFIGQNNNTQSEGYSEIRNCFQKLKQLDELKVSIQEYNNLGEQGIQYFSQGLTELSPQLKKFILHIEGVNQIKNNDVFPLSQGISQLTNLTQLYIRINRFNFVPLCGLKTLGEGFKNFKQLSELGLMISNYEFSTEAVLEFIEEIVQLNGSLNKLILEFQLKEYNKDFIEQMSIHLSKLTSLRYIGLRFYVSAPPNIDVGYMLVKYWQFKDLKQLYVTIVNKIHDQVSSQGYLSYAKRKFKKLISADEFDKNIIQKIFKYY